MKTVYKLTAKRVDDSFIIEEVYFTSKNKALKSLEYLKQYCVYNYDLNCNNILTHDNYKAIQTYIIDNTINVSLINHSIKTLTLKY